MGDREFDIVVVGGGIAGLTAGLTAARAGRKTCVSTGPALGGQLLSIERIDGYPGFPEGVPGYDLCPMIQEQAVAAGAEFSAAQVSRLEREDAGWRIAAGADRLQAGAVVIATGATLKTLGVPGETQLYGKGVSHCASCDAPLLRGRTVGVVGGGDSALQEALTLARHAGRVIVFHRGPAFSAQAAYRQAVQQQPRIEVRFDTIVDEVVGDGAVTGVRSRGADGGSELVEVAGLFVYVGLAPATEWLDGMVVLDSSGRIAVDTGMRTSVPGLLAAGTVRTGTAGRAAAAAGDGAAAAITADRFLGDGTWLNG